MNILRRAVQASEHWILSNDLDVLYGSARVTYGDGSRSASMQAKRRKRDTEENRDADMSAFVGGAITSCVSTACPIHPW